MGENEKPNDFVGVGGVFHLFTLCVNRHIYINIQKHPNSDTDIHTHIHVSAHRVKSENGSGTNAHGLRESGNTRGNQGRCWLPIVLIYPMITVVP